MKILTIFITNLYHRINLASKKKKKKIARSLKKQKYISDTK